MGTDPAIVRGKLADDPAGADSCRGLLYFLMSHLLSRDRYARVLGRTSVVSNGQRDKQGEICRWWLYSRCPETATLLHDFHGVRQGLSLYLVQIQDRLPVPLPILGHDTSAPLAGKVK